MKIDVSRAVLPCMQSATLHRLPLMAVMLSPRARPCSIRAKQSLGQNFLADEHVARRIAGSLKGNHWGEDGERVVELGPGQGALTRWLLDAHPRMTAVEIDRKMVTLLRQRWPMLDLQLADLRALELETVSAQKQGGLTLVSNTPFYLTSPLLFKLASSVEVVDEAVLTMQREVAQKILAPHNNKKYGILSVMLQLFCNPTHLFDIKPSAFSPPPKCTVSVVHFSPSAAPVGNEKPISKRERERVLALLKLTFENRRKMLRHTLHPLLKSAVTLPSDAMLRLRPEQLAPRDFLRLGAMLFGEDNTGDSQVGASIQKIAEGQRGDTWTAHKRGWKPKAERVQLE